MARSAATRSPNVLAARVRVRGALCHARGGYHFAFDPRPCVGNGREPVWTATGKTVDVQRPRGRGGKEKTARKKYDTYVTGGFNRCPPERSRSLASRVRRRVWNVLDWRDSVRALPHVAGRPLAYTPTHPTRMRHPLKLPGSDVRAQRTGWGNGSSVWEICIYIHLFSFLFFTHFLLPSHHFSLFPLHAFFFYFLSFHSLSSTHPRRTLSLSDRCFVPQSRIRRYSGWLERVTNSTLGPTSKVRGCNVTTLLITGVN